MPSPSEIRTIICRHGRPDGRLGIRLGVWLGIRHWILLVVRHWIRFVGRLGIRHGFSALSEDHNAPSTAYFAHEEARTPLGPYIRPIYSPTVVLGGGLGSFGERYPCRPSRRECTLSTVAIFFSAPYERGTPGGGSLHRPPPPHPKVVRWSQT